MTSIITQSMGVPELAMYWAHRHKLGAIKTNVRETKCIAAVLVLNKRERNSKIQ